ncbi:MAG: hypothetical protein COW50_00985 [Candidatus Moranbacteria bacterium CG17_big_fil_post_rev_8_21_14_2_50_41_107]|nr:MAG: hypothetical protein COW50_00985 [Candidatus Moranbacteria bacterium CG17_big_fil_post_rev_8_21_14_2_50_41_107]
MRGIIYIMTTAVSGLIKIGQTGTDTYQERMRNLEANGYYNVVGLKRAFAIELDDYKEKESLLHEIFSRQRIGEGELFALDLELVKQLFLSFEGEIIYPKETNKEKDFEEVAKARTQSLRFSFYRKGLKDGDEVVFIDDNDVTAKVVGEREVEYAGQTWKLSPLAYKLYEERGELTASGAYQGAAYFTHGGKKLKDLPDIYR